MKTYRSPFAIGRENKKEIANLTARADLLIALRDIIESNDWTQKKAAKELGTSQPRISDLVNGKIEKFSIGMLIDFLSRLGYDFKFYYDPDAEEPFEITVTKQANAA